MGPGVGECGMGDKSGTKGKNNEIDDLMGAIFRLEKKKNWCQGNSQESTRLAPAKTPCKS